jgi:hypothetical protein
MTDAPLTEPTAYPVQFSVDYPDRELNRVTTAFRIFMIIPIAIVLGLISGGGGRQPSGWEGRKRVLARLRWWRGLLVLAPLVMILFREKYPRWWFDWNLELLPSPTAWVRILPATRRISFDRRDRQFTSRCLIKRTDGVEPLASTRQVAPGYSHYIVLFVLAIAAIVVVIIAWFAILFTGRYPQGLFDFVVGTMRWALRVVGYAFVMVTDRYPPFSLNP